MALYLGDNEVDHVREPSSTRTCKYLGVELLVLVLATLVWVPELATAVRHNSLPRNHQN